MIFRSVKYQNMALVVKGAGEIVSSKSFTTDRNYKKVVGILALTADPAAMKALEFEKFEINGQEIYPQGYDAYIISCGDGVAPNDRFDKEIDEPAENSSVNVSIKDGSVAGQGYPYTVKIVLMLKNPVK